MYQKGVYYSGIKVFNSLPKAIKDITSKPNKFKIALKHFLHTHQFYSYVNFFKQIVIFNSCCVYIILSSYIVQLYYISLYLFIIHCSFTELIFKIYITVHIYLCSLYLCILNFRQ